MFKTETDAEADDIKLDIKSCVSMNMWGLTPAYIDLLDKGFVEFFDQMNVGEVDSLKGEYLLP